MNTHPLLSLIDPFDGLQEEPGDPPGSDGTGATCTCVDEAFDRWLPHAWVSSKGLWSLAVALFLGAVVVGIVEDEDTLWKSCLAVVVFLVVLGVCAAAIAYRFPSHREAGEEQRQSGGQQGMPVNDVAAMA